MEDVGKPCKHVIHLLFAGIQAAGGAALAVYTYKKSATPIWTIAYSGVTVARACDAFSSAIKLKISFTREPYLKFCELALEPALSVCGTIYLLYFRNHDDECLFWVPIFLTGVFGLKVATSGFNRPHAGSKERAKLLLKAIEISICGWLLTISSTVLAIYGSRKEFSLSWRAFMIVGVSVAVFKIFGSIICLMDYFEMEDEIRNCFGHMVTGHVLFFLGCWVPKCMETDTTMFLIFLFLTGRGHLRIWSSLYELYFLVPRPVFDRYCHRVLGPLLTLYSSAASAYIGCHMGWRFSLPTMAFVPAGVYIAYEGFRGIDETPREISY